MMHSLSISWFLIHADDDLVGHFDSFDGIFEYYRQKLRDKTQS